MPRAVPNEQRFWKHVKKTSTCWLWTAGKDKDGYGKFNITLTRPKNAKPGSKTPQKYVRAHRYSFKLSRGRWPSGYSLLHQCDVRACIRVNKRHVREGTHRRNIRMCLARGRRPHQRLTPKTVREIRRTVSRGDGVVERMRIVAEEYDVSYPTVCGVVYRTTWKWVR